MRVCVCVGKPEQCNTFARAPGSSAERKTISKVPAQPTNAFQPSAARWGDITNCTHTHTEVRQHTGNVYYDTIRRHFTTDNDDPRDKGSNKNCASPNAEPSSHCVLPAWTLWGHVLCECFYLYFNGSVNKSRNLN